MSEANHILRTTASDVEIVTNTWRALSDEAVLEPGDVIVSLERFAGDPGAFALHDGRVGVAIPPGTTVDSALLELVERVDLVAVEFPKFTDGRGYTFARRLREQNGYTGALRAIGDVLPDQLHYMYRCGIDEFDLKPGKSLETGRRLLRGFTVAYQGAADDARPLFRLRQARLLAARARSA